MKLILFLLIIPFFSLAQSKPDALKYDDLLHAKHKLSGSYKQYVSSTGIVFSAGDIVKFGEPSNKIIGFQYILTGDPNLASIGGDQVKTAPLTANGEQTMIDYIYVSGTISSGLFAMIRTKGGAKGYLINIENALKSGELKSSNKSQ